MNSQSLSKELLVDLSDYYVLRKLPDGWIVGSMKGADTRFIPKSQLIEMGYLDENESTLSHLPLETEAIVVPTTTDKRRPNLTAGRADLDQNWRTKK